MLLGAFNQARFVNDARLKFEENLYLHYITESIYITQKVTVYNFLLYFASGMSLLSVTNNQLADWDSTCLDTAFPWWKCLVEITVHVHPSLP